MSARGCCRSHVVEGFAAHCAGDAADDKEEELDDEEVAAAEKEDAKELGEGALYATPHIPACTSHACRLSCPASSTCCSALQCHDSAEALMA